MTCPLTPNTQAILLLTAPLIVGRGREEAELLTPGEYNRLARLLRETQKQPADFLTDAEQLFSLCTDLVSRDRAEKLLGRGFQLSQAIEHWSARGIWVVSRADQEYPRRLKSRLKEDAPAILYGCGERRRLDCRGFAVVGSRHVDPDLILYTEQIGKLAAEAQRTLVSGGAKGIDQAAMHGALKAGGYVIGVMADSLERAALSAATREWLSDGKLVLISAYDPSAGFNVGNAMQRNKVIYALSEAALVVSSDFQKGGTWTGAIEQIDKLRLVPVFVRNGENAGKGNSELIRRGGRPWSEPRTAVEFSDAIAQAVFAAEAEPKEEELELSLREAASPYRVSSLPATPVDERPTLTSVTPADELFTAVASILKRELVDAKTEKQIAEMLRVSTVIAKTWIAKLVTDGEIEKLDRPVRYRSTKKLL